MQRVAGITPLRAAAVGQPHPGVNPAVEMLVQRVAGALDLDGALIADLAELEKFSGMGFVIGRPVGMGAAGSVSHPAGIGLPVDV